MVRQKLGLSICNKLRSGRKDLAVLSLDPKIENQIKASIAGAKTDPMFSIDPRISEKLLTSLAELSGKMHSKGLSPVLLCGTDVRRQIRSLTERSVPRLSVLSVAEIPKTIQLSSFDVVKA